MQAFLVKLQNDSFLRPTEYDRLLKPDIGVGLVHNDVLIVSELLQDIGAGESAAEETMAASLTRTSKFEFSENRLLPYFFANS